MGKKNLEKAIRASLHTPLEGQQEHRERVAEMAGLEQKNRRSWRKMGFLPFLLIQIRFAGWRIWLAQMGVLALITGGFTLTVGEVTFLAPRHIPLLLCCCGGLIIMTAVPYLYRSWRYGMYETELVTRFSSGRLLLSQMIIIGAGDGMMLLCICLLAVARTALEPGAVILYLLVPSLALGGGVLYLLGHVDRGRFFGWCCAMGIGFLCILLILYRWCPAFYRQSMGGIWWLVCLCLGGFCNWQYRRLERQGIGKGLAPYTGAI